jgi:hypothetical protein
MVLNGDAIQDFTHDAHSLNSNIIEIPSIEDQHRIIAEMEKFDANEQKMRDYVHELDERLLFV